MSTNSSSTSTSAAMRTMKTRLPTSTNPHSMVNHSNSETSKSNRIFLKKPLSATNAQQNGLRNHSTNSHRIDLNKSTKARRPSSPSTVFHAIAPAPHALTTPNDAAKVKLSSFINAFLRSARRFSSARHFLSRLCPDADAFALGQ